MDQTIRLGSDIDKGPKPLQANHFAFYLEPRLQFLPAELGGLHHGQGKSPTDQIQKRMGRNRYEVVIAADDDGREKARKAIRDIDEVDRVEILPTEEEDAWGFEVLGKSTEDLRRPLFRMAVDSGRTLLELKPERANLESVFMELTQE